MSKLPKPSQPISVGVKLDESNVNAAIALFKPVATLGVKPDLILEDVDEQIMAYIPKAKIKVNVDLDDADAYSKTKGKNNGEKSQRSTPALHCRSGNDGVRLSCSR